MNAQFVFTKQNVSPLLFRPDALGSEVPLKVGKYSGQICLPRLGGKNPFGTFHEVIAPEKFHAGVLPNIFARQGPLTWGHEVHLPDGESKIGAFLLEFDLAKTKEAAGIQMWHVESHIDHWFTVLRDWIEVISHQDVSIDEPLDGAVNHGNYAWSWKVGTDWTNAYASIAGTTVRMPDLSTALTLPIWQTVVQRANQNQPPPESHLVLRDARARLRRDHYKYSAIFSGIAAEIVIKNQIERSLYEKGNPQAFIDQVLGGTLGRLVSTCKTLGIVVPPTVQNDLVKVRNRAVHKSEVVTKDEAARALTSATQVLAKMASL